MPADLSFTLLAEPGRACDGAEFALFECHPPDDCEELGSARRVSDELTNLLDSARDYPPALALTREDLNTARCRSEIEFAEMLSERLTFHLQEQVHCPHFMAKASKTQIGYKRSGGYYWIVGYANGSVLWVSRDYHVYRDPLDDFDLDADEVERRFGPWR